MAFISPDDDKFLDKTRVEITLGSAESEDILMSVPVETDEAGNPVAFLQEKVRVLGQSTTTENGVGSFPGMEFVAPSGEYNEDVADIDINPLVVIDGPVLNALIQEGRLRFVRDANMSWVLQK